MPLRYIVFLFLAVSPYAFAVASPGDSALSDVPAAPPSTGALQPHREASVASPPRVTLQAHQRAPAAYLLKHPEQKGLILYHSLGSGKTYSALHLAEEYIKDNSKNQVVVFLPSFLESHWHSQMLSFGVKDKTRYQIVSLENPERILSMDLRDTVVIVDEAHKLVQKIQASDVRTAEQFSRIYYKLRQAEKLILLTGTPIFSDISDISYLGNLVMGKDIYPLDPSHFRQDYMRVNPIPALLRGDFMESKLFILGLPLVGSLTGAGLIMLGMPVPGLLFMFGTTALIPVGGEIARIDRIMLQGLRTEMFEDFAKRYVSYYHVDSIKESAFYPTLETVEQRTSYSSPQLHMFLDVMNKNLKPEQLKILLAEDAALYSDEYLAFHSAEVQQKFLGNPLFGREIGNLEFQEGSAWVESPKFLEILHRIQTQPGQAVVYSNYKVNGIDRFMRFLDRHGWKDQYVFLSPEQPVAVQAEVVRAYNQGEKRVLCLHPEVTEGISLLKTEQMYILEPISNFTLQQQLMGRAVRYLSHKDLPKERRKVVVYNSISTVNYSFLGMPTKAGLIRKSIDQRMFPAVNPNTWTKGIAALDSNYFRKDRTPDQQVFERRGMLEKDVRVLHELLSMYAIEHGLKFCQPVHHLAQANEE